jgi:hypothetical protein
MAKQLKAAILAKANLGQPVLHLPGADFGARRSRREHENYLIGRP